MIWLTLLACRTKDVVDTAPVDVDPVDTVPLVDTGPFDDDGDGVLAAEDCDDSDPSVGAPLQWFKDGDGDGYGNDASLHTSCDQPSGSIAEGGDCDDADPAVHPDATEVCDGIDNDCDTLIDGDDDSLDLSTASTWYTDGDEDGWGAESVQSCEQPSGAVDQDGDCDDDDPLVYPGAVEVLDGDDEDCDGVIDEASVLLVTGLNCLLYSGNTSIPQATLTDDEAAGLAVWLDDIDLGMDRVDEPSAGWDSSVATLSDYPLVLYTKCGWAWDSANQAMVTALLDARSAGSATFLFDDDITFRDSYVTGEEPLTLMPNSGGNGDTGVVTMTGANHAAYAGPYGTPVDFTYSRDMDLNTTWGNGEEVLATLDGAGPVWAVYEETGKNDGRGACYVGNFVANNHDYATSQELAQHEIIFKNTVTWLLRL